MVQVAFERDERGVLQGDGGAEVPVFGAGGFFIFLRSFLLFTTGNFTMDFASLQLVN